MMKPENDTLIVIPARYHSSRFPGKPLAPILGKPMLQRVWEISQSVAKHLGGVDCVVATEDERIVSFCDAHEIPSVLTSEACQSGTARAREALLKLKHPASFVVNLQGDNALCPPWFVESLVSTFRSSRDGEHVITPYVALSWSDLDRLRDVKMKTPFSGTCVVLNRDSYALWFSKQIIPAIRGEESLRTQAVSPVNRHIGLYGYHRDVLINLEALLPSRYEAIEGLEQLVFLENGIPIKMVEVDYRGREGMSGIDSPEDVKRAEEILKREGEMTL